MINDLGEQPKPAEELSRRGIKPYETKLIKNGPDESTGFDEEWTSSDIDMKDLGLTHVCISFPKTREAIEDWSIWKNDSPAYIIDNKGRVSSGRSRHLLKEGFGVLMLVLESSGQSNRSIDGLLWFSEDARFRGALGEGNEEAQSEFKLEGSGDTRRHILVPPDEQLLKRMNIAFESYDNPEEEK